MSVNDAIKDMLYGHEHRWRVAEHELAQARSEVARLTAEVEAMRDVEAACRSPIYDREQRIESAIRALDALRARKGRGQVAG